jgi:hypothetical protein
VSVSVSVCGSVGVSVCGSVGVSVGVSVCGSVGLWVWFGLVWSVTCTHTPDRQTDRGGEKGKEQSCSVCLLCQCFFFPVSLLSLHVTAVSMSRPSCLFLLCCVLSVCLSTLSFCCLLFPVFACDCCFDAQTELSIPLSVFLCT